MATMRQIDTRFWIDTWVRKLNALDRYAFIYFLTNIHSTWCGVYEIDISMAAFESGIDEHDLLKSILPRLSPKIIFIDGWVYIKNFQKYHENKSEQTKKGIENAWNNVPEEIRLKIEEIEGLDIPPIDPLEGASPSSFTSSSSFSTMCTQNLKTTILKGEKNLKNFRDARRIESGRPPMTPRKPTEKQKNILQAFDGIEYFKKVGYEQHGMMFMEVKNETRDKRVRSQIIDAQKILGDLKEFVDWWFTGEGEFAQYEPEACFTGKMIERFKNSQKKSNNKNYIYINGNNIKA